MTRVAAVALAAAALFLARAAGAQDSGEPWRYRIEVFGEAAHGGFYNGDSKWGSGADFGGGVGIRPFDGALRGLGFELRAARLASEKGDLATYGSTLNSRMIAANVLYHFRGRTRAQPFVYGGIGVTSVRRVFACDRCVYTKDPETGALAPVPQKWDDTVGKAGPTLGCGVKIALTRRLSIRPELSLLNTTPGSGWNFAWVRAQIGVGLHF